MSSSCCNCWPPCNQSRLHWTRHTSSFLLVPDTSQMTPSSKIADKYSVHIRWPYTRHVNSLQLSCSHHSSTVAMANHRLQDRDLIWLWMRRVHYLFVIWITEYRSLWSNRCKCGERRPPPGWICCSMSIFQWNAEYLHPALSVALRWGCL